MPNQKNQSNLTDSFCKAIRKRTSDHTTAAELVASTLSQIISILRQELDSLIRVVYLLSVSGLEVRNQLMTQTLNNQPWSIVKAKGKIKKVTDREMVELSSELFEWTRSVYKYGCAFIHLSGLHGETNPLSKIDTMDRRDLLEHMRRYHGGPVSDNPTFEEFCQKKKVTV